MHRGIATRLRTDMDFMLPILLDQEQMRIDFVQSLKSWCPSHLSPCFVLLLFDCLYVSVLC